uniref:Uncharacterized protein n=1 Tax=Arundo donax TaxID=35708 RepID=A0A0A9EF77_ARUDO
MRRPPCSAWRPSIPTAAGLAGIHPSWKNWCISCAPARRAPRRTHWPRCCHWPARGRTSGSSWTPASLRWPCPRSARRQPRRC